MFRAPVISNTGGSKYTGGFAPRLSPKFSPCPSLRSERAVQAAKRLEGHAEPLPVRPGRVKAGEATPRKRRLALTRFGRTGPFLCTAH